jgi:hypothetical protein
MFEADVALAVFGAEVQCDGLVSRLFPTYLQSSFSQLQSVLLHSLLFELYGCFLVSCISFLFLIFLSQVSASGAVVDDGVCCQAEDRAAAPSSCAQAAGNFCVGEQVGGGHSQAFVVPGAPLMVLCEEETNQLCRFGAGF